ncbi:hypothetical protein M3Y99_00937300 [Aphelenchoides fujianensis]|nr:hypothetical protein M3Y99_00937300 [Aphelenchoides fujianensis]
MELLGGYIRSMWVFFAFSGLFFTYLLFDDATQFYVINCQFLRSRVDEDGRLVVTRRPNPTEICSFRCWNQIDDNTVEAAEWTPLKQRGSELTGRPNCDVFDVRCKAGGRLTYKFMHSHIYPKPLNDSQVKRTAPDVHVIVLDSVSWSHAHRALPRTLQQLREVMGGVSFRFLNKIGINSQPNAYGFLLGSFPLQASKLSRFEGERAEDLPPNPFGAPLGGGRLDELCNSLIKDEPYVGFDFRQAGFRTLMNEDFAQTVFHGWTCRGFGSLPSDHYMRAFWLRVFDDELADRDYKRLLLEDSCKERHDHILHNLDRFIGAYPNEPKFSLNWITMLAHHDANDLYHADDRLAEYFKNEKVSFEQQVLPRNCSSLLIPFHYCLCQPPSRSLDDRRLARRIGERIVRQMNDDLRAAGHAARCRRLSLDAKWPVEVYEFTGRRADSRRFLKAVVRALPSRGIHEAHVEVTADGSIHLVDRQFPRLTVYRYHAQCIPGGFLQNYCHCKK